MAQTQYLERQRFSGPHINTPPAENLEMVIVIPCHDEPDLNSSLQALESCNLPQGGVEVITVINASERDEETVKARNNKTLADAKAWCTERIHPKLTYHFILNNQLPAKHAGVGLARKIGMDESAGRLEQVGKSEGIIVCFDADSRCDTNYLVEIEQAFRAYPHWGGASIHFEHPLQGREFESSIYEAITHYELHLRYHNQGLRLAGHPQAFHTIGSSMAVRANRYQLEGGMNRRKAGEDFYFLQKIIQAAPFGEITGTRVIPSPRGSHRVPFGTGKAVNEALERKEIQRTYPFKAYLDMGQFMEVVRAEYIQDRPFESTSFEQRVPSCVIAFLETTDFAERRADWIRHGKQEETYLKRFYGWFNLFRAMKFIHFARDEFYGEESLEEALTQLMGVVKYKGASQFSEWLLYLRKLDRNR